MSQETIIPGSGLPRREGFSVTGGIYSKEIGGERYDFRRITNIDDLEATTPLQKAVFFPKDPDYYVCPGHMLATLNKLGGIVIAGYNSTGDLKSFSYNWPMVDGGRSDLLLMDMIGVSPEVQNKGVGLEAMKVLLMEASAKGFREIRFTYDPLKMRNANVYLRKVGAKVVGFEEDPYGNEGLGGDRFLASWDISDPSAALNHMSQGEEGSPDLTNYPKIGADDSPNEDVVLLPAPADDNALSFAEICLWRQFYRNAGKRYFPEYSATNFIAENVGGVRKNHYVLSRKVPQQIEQ